MAVYFYNSKTFFVFFSRSVHIFSWFLKSNWSSYFGDIETGSGVKQRVVLRHEFFFVSRGFARVRNGVRK